MPLNQEDYARLIAELTEANTAARSKKAELEVRKEAAEFNLNTFRNEKEALGIWILPSKSPGKCKWRLFWRQHRCGVKYLKPKVGGQKEISIINTNFTAGLPWSEFCQSMQNKMTWSTIDS